MFRRQCARWKEFRKWQQDNRGIDDQVDFLAYIEADNRWHTKNGNTWQKTWRGRTEEQHIEALKRGWENERGLRQWERENIREVCDARSGFSEYVQAVKRRLEKHNFTRPFQLEEDSKTQDKLSTWIEYLGYECWWYDKYISDVKRLQPKYDEGWQKLVDSGVLRPSETDAYLRSTGAALRSESEKEAARKAVESAMSVAEEVLMSTQIEPQRSSFTKPVRIQMMREAHFKLDLAQKALREITRRGDLIHKLYPRKLGLQNSPKARKTSRHSNAMDFGTGTSD